VARVNVRVAMARACVVIGLCVSTTYALTQDGSKTQEKRGATTQAATAPEDDQKIDWLFVQTATAGSFDGKSVTLHNVPPTLFFSDRPYRIHGHMDTSALIDAVSKGPDSFAHDPPNAILSTFAGSRPTVATVTLFAPTIDGNSITYPIKVLQGDIPASFAGATLFIDHWHGHPHGHSHGHSHWHPPVGAFVAGAVVGSAVTHASQPKTVVVQQPTYYYQATPPPSPAPPSSPTQTKLQELKSMYDQGLITESDYNAKKAQLLKDM
jgi:hypothetical protein